MSTKHIPDDKLNKVSGGSQDQDIQSNTGQSGPKVKNPREPEK